MPRNTPLRNLTATLATTAPVLAMVAGLATAHMIASTTGIITQDSAMGDHPRRAARSIVQADASGPATSFGTANRRDARAVTDAGHDIMAKAANRDDTVGNPARARIMSRQ